MCDRFVDSLWVVLRSAQSVVEHRHTLGAYRHTLGISAELPKVSWFSPDVIHVHWWLLSVALQLYHTASRYSKIFQMIQLMKMKYKTVLGSGCYRVTNRGPMFLLLVQHILKLMVKYTYSLKIMSLADELLVIKGQ